MRVFKWIFLSLLVCLLVACQNTNERSGSVAGASEVTLTATSRPTHTPRPTGTATSTPTLAPTRTATPTATPFVCSVPGGETRSASFTSEAMFGEEIRYLVHLPPCYAYYRAHSFPVLYLLHGWPMDEQHWVELGVPAIVDEWSSRELIGPLIVVMPGVANPHGMYVNSSGGAHSVEGMVIDELLPLIDSQYRTWRTAEGRAIGGISRGGIWSLEIGLRNPDLFGVVGGHSPALAVNYPLPAYDPFLLAENGAVGQRIYLSAGDADWARRSTMRLYDLLLENGADVQYQTGEGAHVDRLWKLSLPNYLKFYTESWPRSFEDLPLRD